jgi:cytoskeleton protein RodZ
MTTDKQPIDIHDSKAMPFGKRLQSAREAMHLERKDVAAQLRLNERIIFMMEKNRYAADIPVTFIRGYLRSYAKFLNIPEYEMRKAVEHIKARPLSQQPPPNTKPITLSYKGSYYFMHFFTFLIVVTLISLIGTWWYSQNPAPVNLAASGEMLNKANELIAPLKNEDNTSATTTKITEPAAQAAPIQTIASKTAKATLKSEDYDDDEDD